MKSKITIALSAILVIAFSTFQFIPDKKSSEKILSSGAPESIGDEDNPDARAAWELMRLADPATGKIPKHIRSRELQFAATLPQDGAERASTLTWSSRGPWNVGGMTRALAIDVTNENILLAGNNAGGMWRSTNGGSSWTSVTSNSDYHGVTCITQDQRSGHTSNWYFGSGDPYCSASGGSSFYSGNGIYKSVDGGLTWNSLPATTTNILQSFDSNWDIIYKVKVNDADTTQDVVYAATYNAIYKSVDGGNAWSLSRGQATGNGSFFTDVNITTTGVVYGTLDTLGAQKGIWRSADGTTWTKIQPSTFPTSYNRIVSGIDPSNENVVYFLGNTPGFGNPDTNFLGTVEWNSLWRYTYLSGNGDSSGGMWENLSANLPTTGGTFDKFQCQGSYDLTVKVKPDNSNVVIIGGTNLYRSTTAFNDSSHTTYIGGYEKGAELPVVNSYLNHHPDQHEILFLPSNPDVLLSGNDGGVFRTDNCLADTVAWVSHDNGYLTSQFYTIAIDHATAGNNIIIAGAQDNGSWWTKSTNQTTAWVHPHGGDGSYCAIADHQSTYFFSIQNGKVVKATLDSAGNKTSFARIDPIGGKGYLFINPFTIDPNNNNIMYLAAGHKLWRNNDLSAIPFAGNWDSISTNWMYFPDTLKAANVTCLTACKTPANRLYFGSSNKRIYRVDSANIANPDTIEITHNIVANQGYANCIAVDPTDGNHLMVVYSNYNIYSMWESSDAGATWRKAAGNLEQFSSGAGDGPSCRWAAMIPVNGGIAYLVGTSIGLFGTSWLNDTNTVWTQLAINEIGRVCVDMIDYRVSDGLIVVATQGGGIYSTTITDATQVGVQENVLKNKISVSAFPNPFNVSTHIHFAIAHAQDVTVKVFDISGKLISTLCDSKLGAGEHQFILNRKNLSAGIYFVNVKAGNINETKKIVLLKE